MTSIAKTFPSLTIKSVIEEAMRAASLYQQAAYDFQAFIP
jgi:hypothetical protein